MAILSLDDFTVSYADLHGTTPDGGGVPAQQVGAWRRINPNILASANGIAFALSHAGNNTITFYALDGAWTNNYRVTVNVPTNLTVNIGARFDLLGAGYVLQAFPFGAQYSGRLFRRASGGGTLQTYWTTNVTPTAINTWSLEVNGNTLKVFHNGIQVNVDVIDINHPTGTPALGLTAINPTQTIAIPSTTAQMDTLWDDSGDLGSVDWFKTTIVVPVIYAHITGPKDVASADSQLTRTIFGFELSRQYLIITPKVVRMCGQSVGESSFPEVLQTSFQTSSGAGELTLVHEFHWNRSGLIWSINITQFVVHETMIGNHNLDSHGIGTITADTISSNIFVKAVVVNYTFANIPSDGGTSLERREWMTRVGVAPNFDTQHFAHDPPGSYQDVTFFNSPSGTQGQGFGGQIFNGPGMTDDSHFEHIQEDRIIGGDTWFKATRIYGPLTGVELFKIEDLVPCTGPPPNPYPDPPPVDPTPWIRMWPQKNILWNPESTPPKPMHGLVHRPITIEPGSIRMWVMKKLGWRPILFYDGETIEEPNTDFPPHYDPCNLLPPILPPGDIIPLVGRYFGMSNSPPSVMGPLFTGTQIALGSWTQADLSACVAKGLMLMTAQGGSNGIKGPGNTWVPAIFQAGTIAKINPHYSMLVAHTPQYHVGYSMMDDLASRSLWRPNGVIHSELATVVAVLLGLYPGIRLGIRARPSQFASNLGFNFYSAQYHAALGSAFSFGATEYSIAASRGAFISLDLNYVHGGNGSSGHRYLNGTVKGQSDNNWECSPAEVVSYFSDMYDGVLSVDSSAAWLMGSKGYQYNSIFLGRPGMIDGLVLARNALAALPPP